MGCPACEKLEVIRQVERSPLSAKQHLDMLGIPRTTFYRPFRQHAAPAPAPAGQRVCSGICHRAKPGSRTVPHAVPGLEPDPGQAAAADCRLGRRWTRAVAPRSPAGQWSAGIRPSRPLFCWRSPRCPGPSRRPWRPSSTATTNTAATRAPANCPPPMSISAGRNHPATTQGDQSQDHREAPLEASPDSGTD